MQAYFATGTSLGQSARDKGGEPTMNRDRLVVQVRLVITGAQVRRIRPPAARGNRGHVTARLPVGPVNDERMQRTAEAMLQFGILTPQYATEVRSGTLVRSMIAPDQPPPRPQATPTRS